MGCETATLPSRAQHTDPLSPPAPPLSTLFPTPIPHTQHLTCQLLRLSAPKER